MRALGGLAAITALVGFISKGETSEGFRWGLIFIALCLLILIWIAIWILDARYYGRLLQGAVDSIKELENADKLKTENGLVVRLSIDIEKAVHKGANKLKKRFDPRIQFYLIVLLALLIAAVFSFLEFEKGRNVSNFEKVSTDQFFLQHEMCPRHMSSDSSTTKCERD